MRGCYGRFLRAINNIAPTKAIATIIAAVESAKYISVGCESSIISEVGLGTGASTTPKAVWAHELP